MKLKEKFAIKSFIPNALMYILISELGLLFILAFYLFARLDAFYLYDDNIMMKVNGTYKIDADADYDIKKLDWYVTNPEIATISDDGTISAHSLGETTVVVKSRFHWFEQHIKLRVSNFTVYSIVFEEEKLLLEPKQEFYLAPVLNGDADIKSNLEWKSSNEDVATVSDTGKVNAVNVGRSIITARDKYTGLGASIYVDVIGEDDEDDGTYLAFNDEATDEMEDETIAIENITLNTTHLDMYINDTRKISTLITPSNATDKTLIYSSSDNSIATVNGDGMVTAKAKGICNIFVSTPDGSVSVSMIVKVLGNQIRVQNIEIKEEKIALDINENYVLVPNIIPSDASNPNITYTSSNNSVASIDANGKIRAVGAGTSTIVAITKDGRKTASTIVEVSSNEIAKNQIAQFSFTGFKPSMVVGESNQVHVEALNEAGEPIKINLTTSNHNIATVDQEGNILALSTGIVSLELEAYDNSYHASYILTILPGNIEPEMVYINKSVLELAKGETDKLVATVIPENATDKNIVWSSSNPTIATVNANGEITALSPGTVTITAQVRNTGIARSVKVAVVNKKQIIDIRKQTLTAYYTNFKIYDEGTTYSRAMQNFAIANIGTNKEILYTSLVARSNIHKGTTATNKLKQEIMRTYIVRIPRAAINSPNSKDRTYMYLNNSGHGQTFDLDANNNYIWSNGNGYTRQDEKGVWWGGNKQLVRVAFKKNSKTSSFSANKKITITNSANEVYDKPELSFDWDNDLAAVRSGRQVLIYKASDFVNGHLTLMYSFTLANTSSNGTNYSRQGHDLANGYYYQYRGYVGTKLYVEVYNLVGELQYTHIFSPKLKSQEAEGLKIYNNRVFIGITSACTNCSGRVNNIYYFK